MHVCKCVPIRGSSHIHELVIAGIVSQFRRRMKRNQNIKPSSKEGVRASESGLLTGSDDDEHPWAMTRRTLMK